MALSVQIPLPVPYVPPFPGVPGLPVSLLGVPPLPPTIASSFPIVPLAFTDSADVTNAAQTNQWGIYDPTGTPILTVDSVASVEYARDYRISDYQQEQGAFESYNKVQLPYEAKLGFLVGESRFEFLNEIEGEMASLDFLSIYTPEITYPNANLVHYGYRRVVRNGVTLILVEVWCEEVRVPSAPDFSNTQSVNGQGAQQNGTTQSIQSDTPPVTSTGASPVQPISILSPSTFTPLSVPPPNSYTQLTGAQQSTAAQLGAQLKSSTASVTAPDTNGNAVGSFFLFGLSSEP